MARSRNIKPSFFTNDELAELPALVRLLFIGLWTLADREGRLEDRPVRIKAEVLPYDNCKPDAMLAALQDSGFILRYQSGNCRYIQILAFTKHQNPHVKESASTIPAPYESGALPVLVPDIPAPAGLIPDSGFLIPDSKEKQRHARARPPTHPLPADFAVSDRVRKWAAGKGYSADPYLEPFIGKAKAKSYVYADWDEAFMGCIREDWFGLRKPKTQADKRAATAAAMFGSIVNERPSEHDITGESERVA